MYLAAAVRIHLREELTCEGAILDLREDLLHLLTGLLSDETLTGAVIAVLRRVGDRVTHLGEAALVDEVDDQLHLVAGLEVRHLRRIASLNEGIEARVDELTDTTTKNRLLAEEIRLGLLLEGGLKDTRTTSADAGSVCKCGVLRLAGEILLDTDQARNALPLDILAANGVTRSLRCDHDDVDVLRRHDGLKVDVEAVREGQGLALGHVRSDLLVVDICAELIRHEHHDDIAGLGCLLDLHHMEVRAGLSELRRLLPVTRALTKTDHDIHAALCEVLGMRMAL